MIGALLSVPIFSFFFSCLNGIEIDGLILILGEMVFFFPC